MPGVQQNSGLLSTFPHSWQMKFLAFLSFQARLLMHCPRFPFISKCCRQAWCQRQRPCKISSMDVSSLVQATSFSHNYSYQTWNSTCLPAVVVSWFFRPWWLAWNNLALNLHWRAMAACWMLVQRPNDGGIGKLLKSIYLSSVFTTFQHCSTCIELQMTFETWSKRKFSGSLLLWVDFSLSETYMTWKHVTMQWCVGCRGVMRHQRCKYFNEWSRCNSLPIKFASARQLASNVRQTQTYVNELD